jgi:hypothetical protein
MDDEEWAFFSPFLVHEGVRSGRPPADYRRILNAVFCIARTGAICMNISANGVRSTAISGVGR